MRSVSLPVIVFLVTLVGTSVGYSAPVNPVSSAEKCPVCGMFVAKYEQWLAQMVIGNNKPLVFDGVKDMMAYYFDSGRYGDAADTSAAEIWVRNYYTLDYIDGRKALYVIGSDVLGPMGDELIPFATEQEAENFKKDHHGKEILRFDEITAARVMEMKQKHMMKMKKKKAMKKGQ